MLKNTITALVIILLGFAVYSLTVNNVVAAVIAIIAAFAFFGANMAKKKKSDLPKSEGETEQAPAQNTEQS